MTTTTVNKTTFWKFPYIADSPISFNNYFTHFLNNAKTLLFVNDDEAKIPKLERHRLVSFNPIVLIRSYPLRGMREGTGSCIVVSTQCSPP